MFKVGIRCDSHWNLILYFTLHFVLVQALNIQSVPALEGLRKMFNKLAHCKQCDGAFDSDSSVTVINSGKIFPSKRYPYVWRILFRVAMLLVAKIVSTVKLLFLSKFCRHSNNICLSTNNSCPTKSRPTMPPLTLRIMRFWRRCHDWLLPMT